MKQKWHSIKSYTTAHVLERGNVSYLRYPICNFFKFNHDWEIDNTKPQCKVCLRVLESRKKKAGE